MEKANIKFKGGVTLNVDMNGGSFIADSKPAFPDDLSDVVVTDSQGSHAIAYAELVECASVDGRYWFALTEVPESVREKRQLQANIEYIAMMADVDLDGI